MVIYINLLQSEVHISSGNVASPSLVSSVSPLYPAFSFSGFGVTVNNSGHMKFRGVDKF